MSGPIIVKRRNRKRQNNSTGTRTRINPMKITTLVRIDRSIKRVSTLTILSRDHRREFRRELQVVRVAVVKRKRGAIVYAGKVIVRFEKIQSLTERSNALSAATRGSRDKEQVEAGVWWKRRAKIVAVNIFRGRLGVNNAVTILEEFAKVLTVKRLENMIPEVKGKIKGHPDNQKLVIGKIKQATAARKTMFASVTKYLKDPTAENLKTFNRRKDGYNKIAAEALQYYGAALKFQEEYGGLIRDTKHLQQQIREQQALIGKIAIDDHITYKMQMLMDKNEATRITKQLKWLKQTVDRKAQLIKQWQARLQRYRLENIVHSKRGMLIENGRYATNPHRRFLRNKAMMLSAIAWQPMLAQRIQTHWNKGYFEKRNRTSAGARKSLEDIQKLITLGIASLTAQRENVSKFVTDPDNPQGRSYAFEGRTKVVRIKQLAITQLQKLQKIVRALTRNSRNRKTLFYRIGSAFTYVGKLNHTSDRIYRDSWSTEMMDHFDNRSWWEKHKRVVADLAVIGLGITAEFVSGGTATPFVLAAEALYFGGTHSVDYYGRYLLTKKTPKATEVLATLAMVLVPGGRAARKVIIMKNAKMLQAELKFAAGVMSRVGGYSVLARRLMANAVFKETGATRVITLTSDVAGKYLLTTVGISVMIDPTLENVLHNAAFFAMGTTRGLSKALRRKSMRKYSAHVEAAMRGVPVPSRVKPKRKRRVRKVLGVAGAVVRGAVRGATKEGAEAMERTPVRLFCLTAPDITALAEVAAAVGRGLVKGGADAYKEAVAAARTSERLNWNQHHERDLRRTVNELGFRGLDENVLFKAFLRYRKGRESEPTGDVLREFGDSVKHRGTLGGLSKPRKRQISKARRVLKDTIAQMKGEVDSKLAEAADVGAASAAAKAKAALEQRFRENKVEETVESLSPKDAKEMLELQGFKPAEIAQAMSRYAKESARQFQNDVKNRGKDGELVDAIEKGGAEAGERYLIGKEYSKEAVELIMQDGKYDALAQAYAKAKATPPARATPTARINPSTIKAVRDNMPSGYSRADAKAVVIGRTAWQTLSTMATSDRSKFQSTITKLLAAARIIRNLKPGNPIPREMSGIEAKGSNIFSIEVSGAGRLLFTIKDGTLQLFDIFREGRHDQYETKLNTLTKGGKAKRDTYIIGKMTLSQPLG